ncbi:MAG: hypothetical protein ACLPT4_05665 [Verrucomicrobiia bacterium]
MRRNRRLIIVTSGICLIACGLFGFLFYTGFGLDVQISVVLELQKVYLRFFSSRLTATNNADFQGAVAAQLNRMGFYDLQAADEAFGEAIAQRPDPRDLRDRAYIEMRLLSYSNAAADFQQALMLWKQQGGGFDFDPGQTSNNMEMARACAEAKQKYWEYWKNRSANPPPASDSKPASPSAN